MAELGIRQGQVDLLSMAASQGSRGSGARAEALNFLEMLLGLLRDILVLELAPGDLEPWNADLDEALRKFGRRWGTPGLIQAMDRVETAVRDVGEINTNPSLTLESLVIGRMSLPIFAKQSESKTDFI